MTHPTRLSEDELRAWMALRLMTRHLEAHLARELGDTSELSMQDYDVLSSVAPLPGHRWCSRKLVDHLRWSYSRMSHHIDRMEKRSLVSRESCVHGSGLDIVVTAEGMEAIRSATGPHLSAVRRSFVDRLEPGDLATIERISENVLGGLPGATPGRGW